METVKIGKDLGLVPIKFQSKWTVKEVEEVIKSFGDLLHFFCYKPITAKVKAFILQRIADSQTKVGKVYIAPGDPKAKKRDEFLWYLSQYRNSLLAYQPADDVTADVRASKFLVSRYLRRKSEMKAAEKLTLIQELKTFSHFYKPTSSLQSVQNELLESFKF